MLPGIHNKIECLFCYWTVPTCYLSTLWHAALMALSRLSLFLFEFQPNEMRMHLESGN